MSNLDGCNVIIKLFSMHLDYPKLKGIILHIKHRFIYFDA